jgi:FKBP-type peptidyl-prolyl cis-trans isomerase FklB
MKSSTIIFAGICLLSVNAYAQDNTPPPTTTTGATMAAEPQSLQDKNKAEGEKFLAANKTKTGVVTLADGLQYKIIKAGSGAKPVATDSVTVTYSGTSVDGIEFDSSDRHGGPATFPVGAVIPGWTEALQLMPVGSTWELYIPSELAYGVAGAPPAVGPNKVLIFRVTLLNINK